MKKKHKRLMKPTLTDILKAPKAEGDAIMNAMDLGEMLALTGLKLEIECEGQTPEFNAEVTRLANQFRKDDKIQ